MPNKCLWSVLYYPCVVLCASLLYWGFVVFVPNNRQWSGWDRRPRLTPPSYQSQRFQDKLEFSEIFLQCLIKSPPNLADPTKTINLLCQDIWIYKVWFWRLVWGQIIFSGWKILLVPSLFLLTDFTAIDNVEHTFMGLYIRSRNIESLHVRSKWEILNDVFQMRELWKEWTRWNASSPER